MKKICMSSLFLLLLVMTFPTKGFAVDYSITNVEIDAYLQDNGDVYVMELHTYEFRGDFNGITREIVPKEGARIQQVTASEQENTLHVEREENVYKIHRAGNDETITFTITYTIEGAVDVYEDVTQFYWPFFDSRNESTYEHLVITVHPPQPTDDVIAFGYDTAYNTEQIQDSGVVVFQYGKVPRRENGDIRVAYPSSLFPATTGTNTGTLRQQLLAEQQEQVLAAIEREDKKETLSSIAAIGLPVVSILLLFLFLRDYLLMRNQLASVKREHPSFNTLPQQKLSMPAVFYFTNFKVLNEHAMAASLLDLIRQGYVQKSGNDTFTVTNKSPKLHHETILIEWLFYKIGNDGTFHFNDLKDYTKDENNHDKYHEFQSEWQGAVKEEVNQHTLYHNKTKYSLSLILINLLLLPFLFYFPTYELYSAFIVTIVLFLTVLIYAISYRPRTFEGASIHYSWKVFKEKFLEVTKQDWTHWTEDEKMRAYIYGLGINNKRLTEKHKEFIEAFTTPTLTGRHSSTSYQSLYMLGALTSSNFLSASSATSDSSSSSSSSYSSGGTGGGGGGSGAF
ncbi:DUF2207 domain-containing protein [Sutcliffiella cohnii]|uniref:DUF2207 domain-containing protein n=1 Tax=Sutcliffiella cohnii TaxID=33932 RepID=UPI002E2276B8|nr:DUF2207 domain-containing protein [Sutcliffiella cohnii]